VSHLDSFPQIQNTTRFIAIGMGNLGLLFAVIYTMRGDVIRLISARRATRQEIKVYETGI
jgi:uncharacterized DUF497 family protein